MLMSIPRALQNVKTLRPPARALVHYQLRSCPSLLRAAVRNNTGSAGLKTSTDQGSCNGSSTHSLKLSPSTIEVENLDTIQVGNEVTLQGYLDHSFDITKVLSFRRLWGKDFKASVQLVSKTSETQSLVHSSFKQLQHGVPIVARGVVQRKVQPKKEPSLSGHGQGQNDQVEVLLSDISPLNEFSAGHNALPNVQYPPEQRHLELRTNTGLRNALLFRSDVAQNLRTSLIREGFVEIETPLLFKSTPEGAREFVVPTRVKGEAYALPQSPQQYKQILMASGIPKYFQMARCFRDEDLRADRQPEFTQLDLEMAFAGSGDVTACIERLVKSLWKQSLDFDLGEDEFPHISYHEAMSKYGSDKPDMRMGPEVSEIHRIEHLVPVDFVSKITNLTDPIVEVFRLRLDDPSNPLKDLITRFTRETRGEPYFTAGVDQPGVFIYSQRHPLGGLIAFGFEAAEQLEALLELEERDVIIVQARKNLPFSGGSTEIGSLRRDLFRAALDYELFDQEKVKGKWKFLWINKFPLFTKADASSSDPGQEGAAGIASTHHPFTSPASDQDLAMLDTDPLSVVADHYDLVLNGTEIGGGSRRIHSAALQEKILRDILKMPDERVRDFEHLLGVLKSACPPHAGIALGFDRLIAMMLGRESIREVIAFSKTGGGRDAMVNSPSQMTQKQLNTYHLSLQEDKANS